MKKIMIVYDEVKAPEALMTAVAELFPECEIIAVSKDSKILESDPFVAD